MDQQVYQASQIKRRRATRAEMAERWEALYVIVERQKPMTVRQVYYRATVHGIVEKTEDGYNKVQSDLTNMRRAGRLPYGWLADSTRWQRKPETFGSVQEALEDTARLYRKALWRDASSYVEFWLEKDALAGVLEPVTSQYDVPLMVARGYASLSFLHSAAEQINELTVPAYIYHLGDFDPSGVNAAEKIEQTLRELAPDAQISFRRIAVTLRQIDDWSLPTRPTKASDTRSKGFGEISVELDAIEPDQLRDLVRRAIEQHLPADQLRVLLAAEESERDILKAFITGGPKFRSPSQTGYQALVAAWDGCSDTERDLLIDIITDARPLVDQYGALVAAWNAASDGERRRLLIAAEIVEDEPKLPPWST